ncbi:MAG: response regulator [Desulfomonile tiedjei]|uniref:Response regulator n=1 Tax=Desulfomonile tiedjei TaxID=2358 RepID=A0A9D6Z4K1_9BACT|nr:response regulator [Desulfomonile tiedjei]
MPHLEILKGKRLLVVDDEPDVLETVRELLSDSEVSTSTSFEDAVELVHSQDFDLVILDIMGVDGFTLLEECRKRSLPAAMLTAHAITIESINKSVKLGAISFLPKEELGRLPELVAEILTDVAEGRTHWKNLFERLGPYFKERLGLTWDDLEKPPSPPYSY